VTGKRVMGRDKGNEENKGAGFEVNQEGQTASPSAHRGPRVMKSDESDESDEVMKSDEK
jgi:hypothetical protein